MDGSTTTANLGASEDNEWYTPPEYIEAARILDGASQKAQHFPCMASDRTAIAVLLRRTDCALLSAEAERRRQPLEQFLAETLECVAVDLREPPVLRLTLDDVYARRAEPVPELVDDEVQEQPARVHRRHARLSNGPPVKSA